MRRTLDRVLAMIAMLELSDREIESLTLELRSIPPRELRRRIDFFRLSLDQSAGQYVATADLEPSQVAITTNAPPPKIVSRIESALRNDAKLSAAQAANLLLDAFPEAKAFVPSEPGKLGLKKWLARFMTVVPQYALLNFLDLYLGDKHFDIHTDWSIGRRR
jgi:hypothetical protein